jgi:hypothetical protein
MTLRRHRGDGVVHAEELVILPDDFHSPGRGKCEVQSANFELRMSGPFDSGNSPFGIRNFANRKSSFVIPTAR